MCKTCNGEGGLKIQTTWGIHFAPCPYNQCNFDLKAHEKEIDEKFKELGVLI